MTKETATTEATDRPPNQVNSNFQDPVQIATEGAPWGSIHAHGFLSDTVLLSDDAGQFPVGRPALCWVHAERLVYKLDTFTDLPRAAQQRIGKRIWNFYAELKIYRANPSKNCRVVLRALGRRPLRRLARVTPPTSLGILNRWPKLVGQSGTASPALLLVTSPPATSSSRANAATNTVKRC